MAETKTMMSPGVLPAQTLRQMIASGVLSGQPAERRIVVVVQRDVHAELLRLIATTCQAVAGLSRYCDGETVYFAASADNPRIAEHRSQGGRAAFWREGALVLAHGPQETEVLSVQRPAVSRLLREQMLDATDMLVAACAAWVLGMNAELIRAGVKSYGQSATPH